MAKNSGRQGGFVAQNCGKIENCFSVVRVKTQGIYAAGFAGENSGTISDSYAYTVLQGKQAGFAGNDIGNTEERCYFFHSKKRGSRQVRKLRDAEKAIALRDWKEDDMEALELDERIWKFGSKKCPLLFVTENWMYPVSVPAESGRKRIEISDADELIEWAEAVNRGNAEAADAYVSITDDINLRGREWVPIGPDRKRTFTGIFDGGGHVICNFVIKSKKVENKGFFGFLKGEVYNLSVDCLIKGGTYAGGIAAQNEKGVIGCCSANVEISGSDNNSGGLIGRNNGTIFQSYAAGRLFVFAIPILWRIGVPAAALCVLCFTMVAGKSGIWDRITGAEEKLPTFAPVPYDEDAVPIENEEIAPKTDGNFVSFQFKQEITVNTTTGLCDFEFKNPGNSNHNIVVQLQFTDAQAIRVMGSTGRSAEEQAHLEAMSGYDAETYRTVIAESGAIPPGYQLDNLRLVQHDNGATIPPGVYNAMVYLIFYDINTNDRAMLESQLPVEIVVE